LKGFKKDGKFRPTEKRNKSGITKKSFEDVHAEHMINQANAQKILLRHKENLKSDMQECTLCDQQFDKNDPLFDIRISRHVLGMHSKNRTIYSERTGSPSTPMGNHTYGDAKFVPVKEKRNDESIDDDYSQAGELTDEDREKIKRMGGTFEEEVPKKVNGFQQYKIVVDGEDLLVKRYMAFNPSSGGIDDTYTADTLSGLLDYLRHYAEISGTITYDVDKEGKWYFNNLNIFDLTKHPKLVEEMKTWT